MDKLKVCRDCGESKPLNRFHVNRAQPDGRQRYCAACAYEREAVRYAKKKSGTYTDKRRVPLRSEKRCPQCGRLLKLSEFGANRSTRDGRTTYRRPCHNAKGKATAQRLSGSTRHYHLTRRHGIGADEVDALVEQQGGMCPICFTSAPQHVDHDHATGKVRGVLCFNCNGGLGQFKDRADNLVRAIDYLRGTTWRRTPAAPGVYQLSTGSREFRPSPTS